MNNDIALSTLLDNVSVGAGISRAGVTLIPVYLHGDRPVEIATGGAATVAVKERPDAEVPTLVAENGGETPVLLVEGEIVEGGRQTRVLNVSVLVGGRSSLDIPVSCVEQGRWGGGSEFRRGRTFAPRRVRRRKVGTVGENVRHGGERFSDQGGVWNEVHHALARIDVHSASGALSAADEFLDGDHRIGAAINDLVRRGPLSGQCGVVVAHGGRIVSAEVFATPSMLAAHWEAIVRSAMMDAPEVAPTSTPSLTKAVKFLRKVASSPATVQDGVGLGREYHVQGRSLVAQALVHDAALVHASMFALAA